jgi:subtilisin family serine protease
VGCALLLALGLAAGLRAQTAQPASVSVDDSSTLWFVELASPPTAAGGSLNTVRNEKAAFRRAAAAAGLRYQERYAFDTLWNGLSVRIEPGQAGKLARVEGVKAIYPVGIVEAPPAPSLDSGAELATAIAMTGADIAQNELGYTGAGVKVAVMDTGIDYDHPDLGGCFGPSCRVTTGYDFVGDDFNADSTSPYYNPVAVPDEDPDDCGGHGTHVSGIVGANGEVIGVAPGVTFGAYRVFGCLGSTFTDIMIVAMERAFADGMDVLNMSIGSNYQWPEYPTAKAATELVNQKVIVVTSFGNAGANGLYSGSAPGVGEKVIGVAAFDNSHIRLPYFTVNGHLVGYQTMTYSAAPPTSGSSEIVYVGQGCNADTYLADPAGKAALIVRGTCSFAEKAVKAINAGATSVIIHNNVPGVVFGTLGAPLGSPVPVVGISQADGEFIKGEPAPVSLTWTDQISTFPSATGNLISSFSSYGLSPDLSLKPDIGAPGGNIYSTYPLELGGYATISGTSMASPHVAGAVALILQSNPDTSHQAIRAILHNSADPHVWWGNPSAGFLDNVHRQGAGMLDIPGSILATTRVEPSQLSLGESEFGPQTRTLTISNSGSSDVTFALSHEPALATGSNTFTPSFWTTLTNVSFSAPSVLVPAGGKATVDVTIGADATLADRSQYGGYIVISGGGQTYRVPYAGLKGDYQSFTVLTPTTNGFPWLAQLIGNLYYNRPDGGTYTMVGTDVPFFLLHMDHQSRLMRMEVFDANTGKSWHSAAQYEYMGRNSTSTSFFAFDWDGTTVAGRKLYTVPNGTYVMEISVLKALGDADNPAHWESWTSPPITIARP